MIKIPQEMLGLFYDHFQRNRHKSCFLKIFEFPYGVQQFVANETIENEQNMIASPENYWWKEYILVLLMNSLTLMEQFAW